MIGRIHPNMSLQDCKNLARDMKRSRKNKIVKPIMSEKVRQRLHFLPTRKANEDLQQGLFHLQLLVAEGHSRCTSCGAMEMNVEIDGEAAYEICNWLARGPFQDKRTREPDCVQSQYPVHEYKIALPFRTAPRDIQEAAADLVHVAHSAGMPCSNCGETMRLHYLDEEWNALVLINEWLTDA
jgi:hypothetical protein